MFPLWIDALVRQEQYKDLIRESGGERLSQVARPRAAGRRHALPLAQGHEPGRPNIWCQLLQRESVCAYGPA